MNPEITELRNLITKSQIRIREIQDKECPHKNVRVDQTEDYYGGQVNFGLDVYCHDCGLDMWFDDEDEEFIQYKNIVDEQGDKTGD